METITFNGKIAKFSNEKEHVLLKIHAIEKIEETTQYGTREFLVLKRENGNEVKIPFNTNLCRDLIIGLHSFLRHCKENKKNECQELLIIKSKTKWKETTSLEKIPLTKSEIWIIDEDPSNPVRYWYSKDLFPKNPKTERWDLRAMYLQKKWNKSN